MPNIKSAKKRVKTSEMKRRNNQEAKSRFRSCVKKFYNSLVPGSDVKDGYVLTIKTIDQSAAKGLLHKNTASRIKSAVTKKYNAFMTTSAS